MGSTRERFDLFLELIEKLDEAATLMDEYDSIPHWYGDQKLYQAESHTIQIIGKHSGITSAELSQLTKRTPSACSQMVKKLISKGWVQQQRNKDNGREYHLELTKDGKVIFEAHEEFDRICYERNCDNLHEFSDDDLNLYMRIQEKINESFRNDVARTREEFIQISEKYKKSLA